MDDQQSPTRDDQEQASKQTSKKQTPASAYVVLVIFLLGSITTAYMYMNDIGPFSGEFKPGPAITVTVSDITIGESMIGKAANGTITNDTGLLYERVQVEINLYDADGELLGVVSETTDLLVAGQEWRFSVYILDDWAVRAELKGVTGYQ